MKKNHGSRIQGLWRISCVIYDCDGVLFDSLEANRRLYNHIAQSIGRGTLSRDEIGYCHTHTVYESIHYLFQKDSQLEEKAIEFLKEQVDLKDFIVYLKMEPHLLATLDALKEKGIKRAISTNRTTSMKYVMERYGLWSYFEKVVTALDVEHPKPHPESVEKILNEFSIEPSMTIFVGDSEVDRQTALSSGVKFVAYKTKDLPADRFIDDHRALLNFLSNETHPQG